MSVYEPPPPKNWQKMNYKEFYKPYCPAYNWTNDTDHKVYCNPYCPHFLGLSKRGIKVRILVPMCEYEEERKTYIL